MIPERVFKPENIHTVVYNDRLWLFDISWLPEGENLSLPILLLRPLKATYYAVDSSKRVWISQDYDESTIASFKGENWHNKKNYGKTIYKDVMVSPESRFSIAVIKQYPEEYDKVEKLLHGSILTV